jgi:uncharacterized protein
MNMNAATPDRRLTNPVYWLMWLLPASAVVAGLATLCIALRGGDRPLPAEYHWEGARLDEDFARARAAASMGIESDIEVRAGRCHVEVRHVPGDPAALELSLINGSDAVLDRRVRLMRVAAGEYSAACAVIAHGNWRVALGDDSAQWSLRGSATGTLESVALRARSPDGPS